MTDTLIGVQVRDRQLNGSRFSVRFDAATQTVTMAELSKQIDAAVAASQSYGLPAPSTQLLKSLAVQWINARAQLTAKWLAPSAGANMPAAGKLQDDLKVFGRSARGG